MTGERFIKAVVDAARIAKKNDDSIRSFEKMANWYQKQCLKKYPYYDLFEIETGKEYGDAIESRIIDSFDGLKKSNEKKFDAIASNDEKVEIKSIRATSCSNTRCEGSLIDRIVSIKDRGDKSYGTFQQSKPQLVEWFVFHVLYGDGEQLYLVPSRMVSQTPGKQKNSKKITLAKQHLMHPIEGQISHAKVMKYGECVEIPNYNHKAKRKYKWDALTQMVRKKLNENYPNEDWR